MADTNKIKSTTFLCTPDRKKDVGSTDEWFDIHRCNKIYWLWRSPSSQNTCRTCIVSYSLVVFFWTCNKPKSSTPASTCVALVYIAQLYTGAAALHREHGNSIVVLPLCVYWLQANQLQRCTVSHTVCKCCTWLFVIDSFISHFQCGSVGVFPAAAVSIKPALMNSLFTTCSASKQQTDAARDSLWWRKYLKPDIFLRIWWRPNKK